MKSKKEKRNNAIRILTESSYEGSKAARLGTKSRYEWEEWKKSELVRLQKV